MFHFSHRTTSSIPKVNCIADSDLKVTTEKDYELGIPSASQISEICYGFESDPIGLNALPIRLKTCCSQSCCTVDNDSERNGVAFLIRRPWKRNERKRLTSASSSSMATSIELIWVLIVSNCPYSNRFLLIRIREFQSLSVRLRCFSNHSKGFLHCSSIRN